MVSYNTNDVRRLCHTWKACICFGAFRYQFRILVQQIVSSVGSDFKFFI